jgi:magnesium transporter
VPIASEKNEMILLTEEQKDSHGLTESKTSHLHYVLRKKLELAYHKQTSTVVVRDIIKIVTEHSAIDLAYAASELPPRARPVIYENLSNNNDKIAFLLNTDSSTRSAVLHYISDEEIKNILEEMAPDEGVEILEDISERRFRRVMEILESKKAAKIREIKKHQRNTAGRLMTNEFFSFTKDIKVKEAASHIRDTPGTDLTRQIFIVNREGILQGYVPARNLIVNSAHLPLEQVMRPVLYKVTPDASREEVVEIVEKYKSTVLAVVDSTNRLVGVITNEDVLDVIADIADETIANMAGTAEKFSEHEPFVKRFLSRAPWLIVTLCAGLINVGVMSSFQRYDGGVLTFVMFFVPLITGMSGNIGIQCSTILVRSMAIGLISVTNRTEAILKELLIGIAAGTTFGLLCGISVYALDFVGISGSEFTPVAVGVMVGIGLMGACIGSTALGVFSPLFFARIGIDPAVASGPIVTALNDFLSMSIYFLIAIGLSSLFF